MRGLAMTICGAALVAVGCSPSSTDTTESSQPAAQEASTTTTPPPVTTTIAANLDLPEAAFVSEYRMLFPATPRSDADLAAVGNAQCRLLATSDSRSIHNTVTALRLAGDAVAASMVGAMVAATNTICPWNEERLAAVLDFEAADGARAALVDYDDGFRVGRDRGEEDGTRGIWAYADPPSPDATPAYSSGYWEGYREGYDDGIETYDERSLERWCLEYRLGLEANLTAVVAADPARTAPTAAEIRTRVTDPMTSAGCPRSTLP